MQDGCKGLHGFLHGIEWIMFHGRLDYFEKPLLGGRPNTKPVTKYTSSTLIGGKGRVGPSSLHTTLEGPREYVNARWL